MGCESSTAANDELTDGSRPGAANPSHPAGPSEKTQ
jgi:hypothetical protein